MLEDLLNQLAKGLARFDGLLRGEAHLLINFADGISGGSNEAAVAGGVTRRTVWDHRLSRYAGLPLGTHHQAAATHNNFHHRTNAVIRLATRYLARLVYRWTAGALLATIFKTARATGAAR